MSYKIEYLKLVNAKEVMHFPKADLSRIRKTIEEKLVMRPEIFGKPLRLSLKGHRSLRVGDYRVIFKIETTTVLIVMIDHRSVVYKNLEKRIKEMQ